MSAPCARAEADVRQDALLIAPLSGVTTSRELAAANRMGAMGQLMTVAIRARSQHGAAAVSVSELRAGRATPLPTPLSGDVCGVTADVTAFWSAVVAYGSSAASAASIGDAAQRTSRRSGQRAPLHVDSGFRPPTARSGASGARQ